MNKLEAKESDKLPSQTELNPRQNVNAITLRSGKKLEAQAENRENRKSEVAVKEEVVDTTTQEKEEEEEKPYVRPKFHL